MTKISSLTELLGASVDQANDLLPIVDMSETGAARNKKIKITQLLGLITDLVGMLQLKGSTDCSANPNYPAASQGDTYRVSVAGKIGGASGKVVEVSDLYYALADNAGGTEAAVGTSWDVIQGNVLSGSSGIEIEDEGVSEATGVIKLNFVGAGVDAADQGSGEVEVTIPGGISTFALGDATDVDTTGQTSGHFLAYDGAQWEPGFPSNRLHSDVTDAGTPASNVETDLASYTLPAGELSSDGMGVRITAWGTLAATTRARTVTLYFGGQTLLTFSSASAAAVQWRAEFVVLRSGASAQTGSGRSGMGQSGANEDLVYRTRRITGAESMAGTNVIRVTGTVAGAAVLNDIVCNAMLVEIIR